MTYLNEAALLEPWSLRRTREVLLTPNEPTWPNARVLTMDLTVDSATARRWLPTPLRIDEPAQATLFAADYPDTSFGVAYRECGVLLHAKLRRHDVVHCAWMVVDNDSAMILGRELLGFPKKLARIEINAAGEHVSVQVERRGIPLLSIEADLCDTLAPAKAFPRPIVNVRGNPDLVPPLLWKMDVPERFLDGRAAAVDLAIQRSPYDPLHELAIPSSGSARWLRVDLGVPPPDAGPIPRGIAPAGIVSPIWFAKRFPFTVF